MSTAGIVAVALAVGIIARLLERGVTALERIAAAATLLEREAAIREGLLARERHAIEELERQAERGAGR